MSSSRLLQLETCTFRAPDGSTEPGQRSKTASYPRTYPAAQLSQDPRGQQEAVLRTQHPHSCFTCSSPSYFFHLFVINKKKKHWHSGITLAHPWGLQLWPPLTALLVPRLLLVLRHLHWPVLRFLTEYVIKSLLCRVLLVCMRYTSLQKAGPSCLSFSLSCCSQGQRLVSASFSGNKSPR